MLSVTGVLGKVTRLQYMKIFNCILTPNDLRHIYSNLKILCVLTIITVFRVTVSDHKHLI